MKALLVHILPYRRALVLAAVLMLAESAAALAMPWLAGQLAGGLFSRAGAGAFLPAAVVLALFVGVYAAQAALGFASSYLVSRTGERVVSDLRVRVYDHLQSLPLGFFHERRLGDVLALLARDVDVLSWVASGTVVSIVPVVLTFCGALVLMARIDPALAGIAAVAVPLYFLLIKLLGRRIRPLSAQLAREHAAALAIAEQNLGLLPAIKAFTHEPYESARHRQQVGRVLRLSERQLWIQSGLGPLVQFLAAAGIIGLLALASGKVAAGALSPAELVSFLLYGLMLTRPMSALANTYGQLRNAQGALARLLEALAEPPEPIGSAVRELPPARGAIEFRSVCFAYPGREPVLEGAGFRIAAGETVALIGPNGAGKTTLVHLLMRFCIPQGGGIFVDGVDIGSVSLASLRRQIGLVPQHPLLFDGTVAENIAYGRLDAGRAAIEAAAVAAGAHDFITGLPGGYETRIGDRGVKLSGGQQQRVALARALLKEPPILILDEALAMHDPQGEREFLSTAEPWLEGRTVILITHRPLSLAVADRILRVEAGKVREEGGPGKAARLWPVVAKAAVARAGVRR